MEKNKKDIIKDLNRQIKKHEWLELAYSFLNNHKRAEENKNIKIKLENDLILIKLKNAV